MSVCPSAMSPKLQTDCFEFLKTCFTSQVLVYLQNNRLFANYPKNNANEILDYLSISSMFNEILKNYKLSSFNYCIFHIQIKIFKRQMKSMVGFGVLVVLQRKWIGGTNNQKKLYQEEKILCTFPACLVVKNALQ